MLGHQEVRLELQQAGSRSIHGCKARVEASEALLHTTSAGTAHKDFSRKVRVAILAARESPHRNAHKQ